MTNNIFSIGSTSADTCFYLPTAPIIPSKWHYTQLDAIEQLISLNGNHWRKILVIMAKITAPDTDWRHHMPQLLTQGNHIMFGATALKRNAQHHFVCGQQSAKSLNLPILDQNPKIKVLNHDKHMIYLLPYLDYRQCPNHVIADLRSKLDK